MARANESTIGTWRQVATVVDGEQKFIGSGTTLVVEEDGYSVRIGPQVIQRGKSTSNTEVSPCQADVTVTNGSGSGKSHLQIFDVDGDVLIACAAAPGQERPTEFKSPPGSGHTLSVWLRQPVATSTTPQTHSKFLIGGLIFAVILVNSVKADLAEALGHAAEVFANGLVTTLLIASVGMILKWEAKAAFGVGLVAALAAITFSELRPPIEPVLGVPLAHLVSISTAVVAGFGGFFILRRFVEFR